MGNLTRIDRSTGHYRFLIVEDDDHVAMLLKSSISIGFPSSEITTVSDGIDAWQKLRREDFDLVISDWEMPYMEGDELLLNMRACRKTMEIPFLMVSVRKDNGSVLSAIQSGVTAYIFKPFDRKQLLSKVSKLLHKKPSYLPPVSPKSHKKKHGDQDALHERIRQKVTEGKITVPCLPQIVLQLNEIMRNPEVHHVELASMIEAHPEISSTLLSLANSVSHEHAEESTSIIKSIAQVGLEEIKEIVTLIAFTKLFTVKDNRLRGVLDSLFIHSVAAGAAACSIARQMRLDAYEYFRMGLFHDIGKLFIIQLASELSAPCGKLNCNYLLDLIDELHAKTGAMLLSKWNFPRIYSVVALKHELSSSREATERELQIVYLSNELAKRLGFSVRKSNRKKLSEIQADMPGIDEYTLGIISDDVDRLLQRAKSLL